MLKDVGMAVPNTTEKLGVGMAVCRQDMLYKDYTSNLIPTSFFLFQTAILNNLMACIARKIISGIKKM